MAGGRPDAIASGARGFLDAIQNAVGDINIIAGAALQDVSAGASVEGVVAGVAAQGVVASVSQQSVVPVVAKGVKVGSTGEFDVLDADLGRQRLAKRRAQRVVALTAPFDDRVGGIVDNVGVVTSATEQRIGAAAAVEGIVAVAAFDAVRGTRSEQAVISGVAAESDRSVAQRFETFDFGRQFHVRQGDHAQCVGAAVGQFENGVELVGQVDIVAGTTNQRVGAETAVENVVACAAAQLIVAIAAAQAVVAGAAVEAA